MNELNEPMSKPTFTQRAQAVLRDPRAGLLPAPLKSLFLDMAAAIDVLEGVKPRETQQNSAQSSPK